MSKLTPHFTAFLTASILLLGCSSEQSSPLNDSTLRSGPALTETALTGMYMSRTNGDPDGEKFVACLDEFVLRFDKDAQVTTIFTEIAEETDVPLNTNHIAYFTDQKAPERFKRLVDEMNEIDLKTEGDLFNFDTSSTCVLNPEDCTLPAADAKTVRLYWQTIEHGSMGCYE